MQKHIYIYMSAQNYVLFTNICCFQTRTIYLRHLPEKPHMFGNQTLQEARALASAKLKPRGWTRWRKSTIVNNSEKGSRQRLGEELLCPTLWNKFVSLWERQRTYWFINKNENYYSWFAKRDAIVTCAAPNNARTQGGKRETNTLIDPLNKTKT